MIAAGIVAALIVNTVLWPRHCRVLFLESTSQTLGLLSQLYLMLGRSVRLATRLMHMLMVIASRDLFLRSLSYHPRDHRKLVKLELGAYRGPCPWPVDDDCHDVQRTSSDAALQHIGIIW